MFINPNIKELHKVYEDGYIQEICGEYAELIINFKGDKLKKMQFKTNLHNFNIKLIQGMVETINRFPEYIKDRKPIPQMKRIELSALCKYEAWTPNGTISDDSKRCLKKK